MAKGCFVVRAEVPDKADRANFDDWYATDHLPWAIKAFGAQRGWRCWSHSDPSIHYAFYQFAGLEAAQSVLQSAGMRTLIAEFDRAWGTRVRRTRDILDVVQSVPAQAARG